MYEDKNNISGENSKQEMKSPYEGYYSAPDSGVIYNLDPKSKKKEKLGLGGVIALVLAAAILGGVGGGAIVGGFFGGEDAAEPATVSLEASASPDAPAAQTATPLIMAAANNAKEMTPAEVYEQCASGVVAISTEGTATNIFGQSSATASSGSGFIISDNGYIVTNCHVIDGAETIKVTLLDETEYPATLVGSDSDNDVALLKIEAQGLPAVTVGDSNSLIVGEMVVAIGNPLGELTHTLTVGYVSALDREINTDGTPINMFQTDAAINPGNSGGPLFDLYGNVVGITTAKYSDSTIEGLGFAIPINDVMTIVQDLKEFGYVKGRASFGINVKELNLTVASYYDLPVGVYVAEVNAGSCAETAGIQAGDIITGLGGESVKSYTDLVALQKTYVAGDTTTVEVYRSGETLELTVTFDEQLPKTEEETAQEETEQTEQPATGGQYSGGYGFPYSYFFGY